MMLVFESLEVILLRTASDLSHFNMVGITIVKKIISSHMKLLQGSFQSTNHGFVQWQRYISAHIHLCSSPCCCACRFVRQCLNLLSAMVSQGVEAAREVLNHIHIKAFPKLATRRDKRVCCWYGFICLNCALKLFRTVNIWNILINFSG